MHWANQLKKQRRPMSHNDGKGWGNERVRDVLQHILEAFGITDIHMFRDQDEKDEYDAIQDSKKAMEYYLRARLPRKEVDNAMDLWGLDNRGNLHPHTKQSMQNKAVDLENKLKSYKIKDKTSAKGPDSKTRNWAEYMTELNRRRIMSAYHKASPKFRVGRYKKDLMKKENGDWVTEYEDLNCCSKFILAYFWFLRWVKQTSKIRITDDKDFTFEDLGFPPRKVFKNYRMVNRIVRDMMVPEERRIRGDFAKLDEVLDRQDCVKLRLTLGRINREGFLTKYPEVHSMTYQLMTFWDNQPDCDFIYLMNGLDATKKTWIDKQENERRQFQTNTPAATQAELITDKYGQDEWKMI